MEPFTIKDLGKKLMNIAVRIAVILLVHALLCQTTSYADPPDQLKTMLKVRSQILKLGVGEETKLEVKLKDKTKLKGHIREAGEDHFVLVEAGTNRAVTVPYDQVQQGKGQNLGTGAKILIVVGVLFLVGLAMGLLFRHS
jgi:hypothetical protein